MNDFRLDGTLSSVVFKGLFYPLPTSFKEGRGGAILGLGHAPWAMKITPSFLRCVLDHQYYTIFIIVKASHSSEAIKAHDFVDDDDRMRWSEFLFSSLFCCPRNCFSCPGPFEAGTLSSAANFTHITDFIEYDFS